MKTKSTIKNDPGFSLIELLISMTIMLVVLGIAFTLFGRSMSTRQRESSRTDALTSAQAALNVISREIANSGYGIVGNGIVAADSTVQKLHFVSNVVNTNTVITDQGENLTYFFEPTTQSILRYDANGNGPGSPETSIVINRISNIDFTYFDYVGSSTVPTQVATPTANTARVTVRLTVSMEAVQGQVNPSNVTLISDITLRNSSFMLQQY